MLICRQGNGHYLEGINNQDFCYAEGNLKLITDGCSEAKYSEVGTRLFCQFFSALENRFDINKFEENVEITFSKIYKMLEFEKAEKLKEFIMNNMLFTVLACFELEDKFVVKFIGDGYIVTVNNQDMVSYIRLFYGKTPPYYAYNSVHTDTYDRKLEFKTFEFDKKHFKKVGIATDGIMPIVEKKIDENFDPFIQGINSQYSPEGVIKSNQSSFFDDITILI
ncbi:MAG: protein phosphatase 2C domain-containing protein [Clostridia bacterium]|nr:protein phosphatase 2C domain-containing protein [Clostridia bacterium]